MHRAICSPEPNKLDLGHFGLGPHICWVFGSPDRMAARPVSRLVRLRSRLVSQVPQEPLALDGGRSVRVEGGGY